MDIRVGTSGPIDMGAEHAEKKGGAVEARVLAIRSPRRRQGPAQAVERRSGRPRPSDPLTGRVLVLMIPDASRLPEGLASGEFRVFLRFARR